jgi:hypothetical protein
MIVIFFKIIVYRRLSLSCRLGVESSAIESSIEEQIVDATVISKRLSTAMMLYCTGWSQAPCLVTADLHSTAASVKILTLKCDYGSDSVFFR